VAIDVDALLKPVADDNPAGPDLAYDDARQKIEAVFDRGFSSDPSAAAEVDWSGVISLITAQCEETKDIWLGVYLMRAGALSGNLSTIECGAALLAGLFETYWECVHPQIDSDDGAQDRARACESLARIGEFIGPLRRTVLISHPRLGAFAAVDFERFERVAGDSQAD